MKLYQRVLSYVLTAAVSAGAAVGISQHLGVSKLDRLETLISQRFIGDVDKTAIEDAAADAMVDALGDRWSYYIPASYMEAYNEQMQNSYVGIGVTISADTEANGMRVIQLEPNGPADKAGVKLNDIITAVDGTAISANDFDDVKSRIRGEVNTWLTLTVLRDGSPLDIRIQRATFETPVATGELLENNIGYIVINNFDERCASETISQIKAMQEQGADKLIFDVRGNPGGYASELVKVLDYLLPEGDLFRSVDYTGKTTLDTSDAACLELPMAVLVNGDSYSAAEFFACALQEYEWATVVGSQTCGKGYFQITTDLGDGSAVGLSVGKYYTPKGRSLIDVGVVPDIPVDMADSDLRALYSGVLDHADDAPLQAAIAALTQS